MSSIIFRGATIRSADLRRQNAAGVFCRLHMTAALSQSVSDAMTWEPIPACVDETKLAGRLTTLNLVLTPNAQELRSHELRIERSEVSNFRLYRVKQRGAITKERIHFIVGVSQPGAMAFAEEYLRLVGKGEGVLRAEPEGVELERKTGSAGRRRRRK